MGKSNIGLKIAAVAMTSTVLFQVMTVLGISAAISGMMTTISTQKGGDAEASSASCVSDTDETEGDGYTEPSKPSDNALKIAKDLADAGVSKAGVAGILGNLEQESQFLPTAKNPASGAYGIAQWNPGSKLRTEMDSIGLKDTKISDLDGQVKVLAQLVAVPSNTSRWMDGAGRLSNYQSLGYKAPNAKAGTRLFRAWQTTGDPKTAAMAWLFGFEGPGPSEWAEEKRTGSAQYWYDKGLKDITFPDKTKDNTHLKNFQDGSNNDGTSWDDESGDGSVQQASCGTDDSGAVYGKIGDAPAKRGNFDWMCEAMKVCNPHDYGGYHWYETVHDNGYQCTWYAMTRAVMIYGLDWTKKGSTLTNWDVPNIRMHTRAKDIPINLMDDPDWTVDRTPHPGDMAAGWTNHIVIIEEVKSDPSGYKVRMSEGNVNNVPPCFGWDGDGCWNSYEGDRWRTKNQMESGNVYFFRNKHWANIQKEASGSEG